MYNKYFSLIIKTIVSRNHLFLSFLFYCPLILLSNAEGQCRGIVDMTCQCKQYTLQCETNEPLNSIEVYQTNGFYYRYIELIFNVTNLTVKQHFFQPLNRILAKPDIRDEPIKVSLTFTRFQFLKLQPYAFSGIFSDGINATKLTLDFYSPQVTIVNEDTFNGLNVGFLEIFGSNLKADSGKLCFNTLFNHTFVSRLLRLEGTILPPNDIESSKKQFYGHINRLQFSKQVDTVDSIEYPMFPVRFYVISAHNPRNIAGPSFSTYSNLKGLIIHSGNMELKGDKLIGFEHLEELDVNVDSVDDGALSRVAPTLKVLTLGNKIKVIDDYSLRSMVSNLKKIDIRNLDFDLISYPTRCALTDIINTKKDDLEVVMDTVGCECHQLFIIMIKRMQPLCSNRTVIEDCGQYAHCQLVKDYFRVLRSIPSDPEADVVNLNMTFLKQPFDQETSQPTERTILPAFVLNIDGVVNDTIVWTNTDVPSASRQAHDLSVNRILIIAICLILIMALIAALIVWNYNFRRRRGMFQPIPCDLT